jgi:D-sedoheptulose 7-phosphate isomerase
MQRDGGNTRDVIDRYFQAMETINRQIDREGIERGVAVLFDAWRRGGTVFTMGNGGSASTATHFASDLAKFCIVAGKPRLKALALADNIPLASAWTNDNGFGSVYAEQLDPWLRAGDVLVGISVHGGSGEGDAGPWSQNLPRAVALARQRGAAVIGLSGFAGGALKEQADVCVVVPWEREPLGTPLVESYHVALHHLICLALKEMIAASDSS